MNPKLPIDDRIKDLLKRMTLEEKAAQLLQASIGRDVNPNNVGPDSPFNPLVGSVLSFTGGSKARNQFQRVAVEETRLGIPIIWGYDVIHGWRTGFPVSLAQACSFRPELTEALNRVAAKECYSWGGVNWTFAPMVEVAHDPRWGRCVEGYGEDPHTAGCFTAAAVRGFQGAKPSDLSKPGHIAACLKHFVGYSASEGGRDYWYTDISRRALWEWYLPPFKAGVDAGARTLMSSFNDISGTPAIVNSYTETEVLRNRWGFTGFIVSDWGGVSQLAVQRYSSDPAVQTIDCLTAGNDMDMVDGVYKNIPQLVKEGLLPIKTVNTAVERVLRVKFELGLFENPYTPEAEEKDVCRLPEYLDLARECARASMVLLKNDGILPVKPDKVRKIALIGPGAMDNHCHVGSWSAFVMVGGNKEDSAPSLAAKIKDFFPDSQIECVQGVPFTYSDPADKKGLRAAVKAAKDADLVLLAIGEAGNWSGEYKSRVDISLPPAQVELIDALSKTGVPLVGLVTAGRPLAFPKEAEKLSAILYMWQCGYGASEAALEIVTGKTNPSGRLCMSFPRSVGDIPVYYNNHHPARNGLNDYQDRPTQNGAWFDFGYGLSYTQFEYSNLKLSATSKGIKATVTITNIGKREGAETVFWYICDKEASLTQPMRRLISFNQVSLKPGEARNITLLISDKELSYPDEDGCRVLEEGEFELNVSGMITESFMLNIEDSASV